MFRVLTAIAIMFLLPTSARADDDRRDRDREDLRNCNDNGGALPCFEPVWVDGVQRKMDFFDLDVQTDPPTQNFYVVAPQTASPQGTGPFVHDHVVGDDDSTYWHGFLVVCSARGLETGACLVDPADVAPPLAKTVHGRKLNTARAIESATRAGLVDLVDTGAVLLAIVRDRDRCEAR
jgi:hypothetical protein